MVSSTRLLMSNNARLSARRRIRRQGKGRDMRGREEQEWKGKRRAGVLREGKGRNVRARKGQESKGKGRGRT